MKNTKLLINNLASAVCAPDEVRFKYLLINAIHEIIRQAIIESVDRRQSDLALATGVAHRSSSRRYARTIIENIKSNIRSSHHKINHQKKDES